MKKNIINLLFAIFILGTMCLTFTTLVTAESGDYAYLDATLLNQDPDPAEQGEYVDLRWKIVKEGNEKMNNINVHLNVDYPFFFDASDSPDKVIGTWSGWSEDEEYYILHYKLRVDEDALEDTYDVNLEFAHDETGFSTTKDFEIRVGDKKEPEFVLGNLITSPLKLVGDSEDNHIQVNLENIGDESAENVRMELKLPKGFTPSYGYSTRTNLGTIGLDTGKVGNFYFDIGEDIFQGEYNASVEIHYKESNDDDNVYNIINLDLPMYVSGKPMFEIQSIKTEPENIVPGDEVKLILQIKNIGDKDADSVSLRAFKESSQPFDFNEKSDFVGKLNSGESGDIILTLDIEPSANVKTYIVDLEIRSIYNDEVLIENEIIPLKIDEKTSYGWIYLIGVVVILSSGLVYFIKNKPKSKKRK